VTTEPEPASPPETPTPLFEREAELETLRTAVRSASMGSGSSVLVEGPAGIGKSRTLGATIDAASELDMMILRARGGELEREMPFGIARQWFETLLARASKEERESWISGAARPAASALGIDQGDTSATDPLAVVNALYWLTANVSSTRPILMILDDAQWADLPSLRFAAFFVRRVVELPVAFIAAVRTGEPAEPFELQALRVESESIRLDPLSGPGVRSLITSRSGNDPHQRFADVCVTATAGNPFLVIEILRELESEGVELDVFAADAIADLAPEAVARSVLFRLGRFGEQAIELARVLSVLGRSPQLRHVAELARIEESEVAELCDQLRAAEVLTPGLPIEFVHPLVRQAIYAEQPAAHRSGLHRVAAELLASAEASPEERAAHLLACDPNGDPWVARELAAAAEAAIAEGAYDAAVTYLDRALDEPPQDPVPILEILGRALQEADVFRAREVFEEVARRVESRTERVEALRRVMLAQIAVGDLAGAASTCDVALEALGEEGREITLDLEAQRLFLTFASVGRDPDTGDRIERVAGELVGTTAGERVARQALGLERYIACRPIEDCTGLLLSFPELPWQIAGIESPVTIAVPKALAWCGFFDDARRELGGWMELAHQQGRLLAVSIGNSFLSEIDRLSGRLHDAEARARTAWEIAQLPGGMSPYLWSALMNLAVSLLARGDVEAFEELTGGMDLSAGPTDVPLNPWPLEARAYHRTLIGDIEGSVDDFLSLGEGLERIGWVNPSLPPHWRQEVTEGLASLGRSSEAREIISVAEERARSFGAPHTIASVLRARAAIEPRDSSIVTLREAAGMFESTGLPHELARTLVRLGAALRRRGDRSEARSVLEKGLELAHASGAGGIRAAAHDELAASGARPRSDVLTGVGALTASEMRTAKLAAQGLSNKEIAERLFVTVRTVETHLTHSYDKLGIEGRAGLGQALEAGGAKL